MESKESFGEYIVLKRKEVGLTQKALADKLFVTESAVSKWERGISYPDVTLIRQISEALNVTEHELLTASEDTQTRNYEKQAKKYTKLVNRYKNSLIFIYGAALLTCFICNIAIHHNLSWFFIVLASVMTAFSLTLLPVLVPERKAIITLGGFTVSLIILLFVCAVFTGGDWFVIACVSVIFGMTLLFLPFVLNCICLPKQLCNKKTLLYFSINTLLLYLLLFVCNFFVKGMWFFTVAFPIATFCLLLPWGMMFIIRYTKINGLFKTSACLGIVSVFTYLTNRFVDKVLGEQVSKFSFDFSDWSTTQAIDQNVDAIVVLAFLAFTVIFAIAGFITALQKKHSKIASE